MYPFYSLKKHYKVIKYLIESCLVLFKIVIIFTKLLQIRIKGKQRAKPAEGEKMFFILKSNIRVCTTSKRLKPVHNYLILIFKIKK